MYLGFEINDYQNLNSANLSEIAAYKDRAKGRINRLAQYIVGTYKGLQVLDAEKISAGLFPPAKYDVFLSHSHADQGKAIDMALALEKKGLKVFVDSCVWGYFSELISKICAGEASLFATVTETRKLQIAADVHMMLAGALHRMIWQAEAFVFLNTEKSIPLTYQSKSRTLSPWLFTELQFSVQVQRVIPERLRGRMLDTVLGAEQFNESLENKQYHMAFKAFNEHLPKVDGSRFRYWHSQLSNTLQGANVLDDLYAMFELKSKYLSLRA
jgi:hypothetical protein